MEELGNWVEPRLVFVKRIAMKGATRFPLHNVIFLLVSLELNRYALSPRNILRRVQSTRRSLKLRRLHNNFLTRFGERGEKRTNPLPCLVSNLNLNLLRRRGRTPVRPIYGLMLVFRLLRSRKEGAGLTIPNHSDL